MADVAGPRMLNIDNFVTIRGYLQAIRACPYVHPQLINAIHSSTAIQWIIPARDGLWMGVGPCGWRCGRPAVDDLWITCGWAFPIVC